MTPRVAPRLPPRSCPRRRIRALSIVSLMLLLMVVAAVPSAQAHALRLAQLELRYLGDGAVALRWRASDGEEAPRVILGPACKVVDEVRTEFLLQRLDCPGAATARHLRLAGLPSDLPVVLVLRRGTESARVRWLAEPASGELPWFGAGGGLAEAVDYLVAGARHVLSGADHLLFLVALFVLCRGPRELTAATLLFTFGHAASLVAIASGHLTVVPRLAELGIALTLVIAARSIAVDRAAGDARGSAARSISATAAVFGCIHGLGFAGALEEVGMQAADSLMAIASFNVGVEVGQLVFVGALAAASLALRRVASLQSLPWPRLASLLIGGAGVFWCLERVTTA